MLFPTLGGRGVGRRGVRKPRGKKKKKKKSVRGGEKEVPRTRTHDVRPWSTRFECYALLSRTVAPEYGTISMGRDSWSRWTSNRSSTRSRTIPSTVVLSEEQPGKAHLVAYFCPQP